jgi:hypothetical protein
MTTVPNNFNPQIPDRSDAKAFAAYAAGVMQAFAEGRPIAVRSVGLHVWDVMPFPLWAWGSSVYAVIPEPTPPTYRWPTDEEWLRRFTDLRWQAVLVRGFGFPVSSGRLVLDDGEWKVATYTGRSIGQRNYLEYERSLDGGKTWRNPGIQENGVDE